MNDIMKYNNALVNLLENNNITLNEELKGYLFGTLTQVWNDGFNYGLEYAKRKISLHIENLDIVKMEKDEMNSIGRYSSKKTK